MLNFMDSSDNMNISELDIAIERFNIDIKRLESQYLYESSIDQLRSKYYSESEDSSNEKKKNRFLTFIFNMFTKLKNLLKDIGTAIRNSTKGEDKAITPDDYFNSETGKAQLEYDIAQVHKDVEDQIRKSRKFVQFISKQTHIDDRQVEKFVDGLTHTVRKSAVPIALTGATYAAYKACDKKIDNIYKLNEGLEKDAKMCAGNIEKERAISKVLTGVFGMLSSLATVTSIYKATCDRQQAKANAKQS